MWDRSGKMQTTRTQGKHRRVSMAEIERMKGQPQTQRSLTLAYCRCSTHKQEENLERQVGRVLEYCVKQGWSVDLYKDIGSGLNENRKDFRRLMGKVASPDVARVVVEYKDRLSRFGFDTFVLYCKGFGVDVVTIEDSEKKEFEQEFADDIVSLVTSYAARMYGRRGGRSKGKTCAK